MKSTTIRLIVTALALVAALWALVPTYTAYQLDQESKGYKERKDTAGLLKFYDEHGGRDYRAGEKNFLAAPIKLGLDLQGGMYVTMEVDIPGLIAESAQKDAIDEPFQKAIDATRAEAATSDEPVIDIFTRNFDKLVRPAGKNLLNYFDASSTGGDANDEAVVTKLKKNIEDAVDQAIEVIRQRIDKYGVSETTIQKIAGRRIVLELPGVTDAESVSSLLQTTARLEFKLLRNDVAALELFRRIDNVLAGKPIDTVAAKTDTSAAHKTDSTRKADSTKKTDSTRKADSTKKGDSTKTKDSTNHADSNKNKTPGDTANDPYKGLSDEEKGKAYKRDHPFTSLFLTYARGDESKGGGSQDISGIYMYDASTYPKEAEVDFFIPHDSIDKAKILLNRPEVRALLPEDRIIAFSAHAENNGGSGPGFNNIYVLTAESELTGDVVTDAFANFDQSNGQPEVIMDMNGDGADKWADITGKNIGKRVAIVLDSAVYSAPVVHSKIDGGRSSISGSKDISEANLLSIVLKSGALKAPVKIIEERIVGPSLGEDSIKQGITATAIAAALVVLFMMVYYSFGGVVADVAVMLNVMITLAVLAAFNATLTLPGIGGLVLTIGMAVDGNILIYERIREELARGKVLKSAVTQGYDKAFAAIIDTHITTFMTGAILYAFGSGPVRGFAVTLMVGIAATLFTAVFVTKTFFLLMLDRGATSINFGQVKEVTS